METGYWADVCLHSRTSYTALMYSPSDINVNEGLFYNGRNAIYLR